ncbi:MAG: hypothetical protein J6R87_01005, partial [Rikenellaceae bacterium]|nr:hypothetical protein [Rikenellaceae bacterium]
VCGLMGCENVIDHVAPEIIKKYINESGVDIEIIAYHHNYSHTYKIANGKSITLSFSADRISLTHEKNYMYDANEVKVIYAGDRLGKNYDLLSYPIITDEISKRGYVHAEPFTFTYEMFQAATPIEK